MNKNPGKLISMLYRKNQIFWSQYLKSNDITSAEYPILIVLDKKADITQEEIAAELSVDKSGITRIIKSLLEKGLIEKNKDQTDLRCNRIHLSHKGTECMSVISNGISDWNQIISQNIDEDEIAHTVDILTKMAENIDNYVKDSKGVYKHEE